MAEDIGRRFFLWFFGGTAAATSQQIAANMPIETGNAASQVAGEAFPKLVGVFDLARAAEEIKAFQDPYYTLSDRLKSGHMQDVFGSLEKMSKWVGMLGLKSASSSFSYTDADMDFLKKLTALKRLEENLEEMIYGGDLMSEHSAPYDAALKKVQGELASYAKQLGHDIPSCEELRQAEAMFLEDGYKKPKDRSKYAKNLQASFKGYVRRAIQGAYQDVQKTLSADAKLGDGAKFNQDLRLELMSRFYHMAKIAAEKGVKLHTHYAPGEGGFIGDLLQETASLLEKMDPEFLQKLGVGSSAQSVAAENAETSKISSVNQSLPQRERGFSRRGFLQSSAASAAVTTISDAPKNPVPDAAQPAFQAAEIVIPEPQSVVFGNLSADFAGPQGIFARMRAITTINGVTSIFRNEAKVYTSVYNDCRHFQSKISYLKNFIERYLPLAAQKTDVLNETDTQFLDALVSLRCQEETLSKMEHTFPDYQALLPEYHAFLTKQTEHVKAELAQMENQFSGKPIIGSAYTGDQHIPLHRELSYASSVMKCDTNPNMCNVVALQECLQECMQTLAGTMYKTFFNLFEADTDGKLYPPEFRQSVLKPFLHTAKLAHNRGVELKAPSGDALFEDVTRVLKKPGYAIAEKPPRNKRKNLPALRDERAPEADTQTSFTSSGDTALPYTHTLKNTLHELEWTQREGSRLEGKKDAAAEKGRA